MATEFEQLLREMQANNALTAELVKQKKLDDTPKQLLAGNIFEIINDRLLNRVLVDEVKKEREVSENNPENVSKFLVGSTTEGSFLKTTLLAENVVNTQLNILNKTSEGIFDGIMQLNTFLVDVAEKVVGVMVRNMAARGGGQADSMNAMYDFVDKSRTAIDNIAKTTGQGELFPDEEIDDPTEKEKDENGEKIKPKTGAEKEKGKKKDKKEKTLFDKLATTYTKSTEGLKKSFNNFTDKIFGKSLLTVAITLLVSSLIAFVPAVAEFFANMINMFKGELPIKDFIFNNKTGIFITLLAIFRGTLLKLAVNLFPVILKSLFKGAGLLGGLALSLVKFLFGMLGKGLLFAGKFLLGPVGIAVAIGLLIYKFRDEIGEFISTYILDPIMNFFDKISNFVSEKFASVKRFFGFGDDVEGKQMGGPVAAGTPYLVGEGGAELFVPGAAGSIIPAGGFGGTPVVFNTNQVNQSNTSTPVHHTTEVFITDTQQENVGL